ncbi:hypothetical protein DMN91_012305 [Ooceraea biroi]|uniref:Ribonuclease P protein subunit p40 n=1 Tax=Ooceraea biroi TaxID=2015173 RepID=A0A026VV50_OOCBI|nr:ribonuclease P protein subunit p40 [Ooceraea biroi]EZA47648.1 Ribonuclease P protein subunit p40 [Ooceraea biroi]RLU15311.1 hypothetical protein DMN91_012305 [Ooceraea biroi]
MLCPESWNVAPPQHHFSIDRSNFTKPGVSAIIKNHYFNHSISVILPDTITIPNSLRKCQEDTDYYRVNGLRVCDLVDGEFIEAFVKKGEINLLTIENKIDLQNSICITPTGHLILSLVTEDYQALGLEGKASSFEPHTRYVVTIDLKNESFVAGRKNYERVRVALKERLKENFDVIVSWDPPEANICPSSVAAWFCARDYNVCLCQQSFSQRSEYSQTIPTVQDEHLDQLFEWFGIFSINGDLSNEKRNDYVSTYEYTGPSTDVGQVQYLQWTGFFTRQKVQEIYDVLKEYVLSRKDLPWLSFDVQGFADSPISWNLKEHMFFTDGDNSYTVVLQPNGKSVIRKSLSSNNRLRRCNVTNSLLNV